MLILVVGEPHLKSGQTQYCCNEAAGWRTQEGDQGTICLYEQKQNFTFIAN